MTRARSIAALVALAGSLVGSLGRADFERHCEERPLDAAERAAAARVLSAFRAALPAAPAGWTVLKDSDRVSAVACEIPGKTWTAGGELVPQPISINVHRQYLRSAPVPPATAEATPVPVKPAATATDAARLKELEARLDELQRSRKDALRAYQEARRTGDGAAQGAARRRDQETARAMRPVQEELSRLKRAASTARATELEAHTAAAVAHDRAAEERRTDASVSITSNLAWIQLRGAEALDAGGADVAIRQSGGIVLLLGPWKFGRGDTGAGATIVAPAPHGRIQSIAVEITGSATTAEALRARVGVSGLRRVVGS